MTDISQELSHSWAPQAPEAWDMKLDISATEHGVTNSEDFGRTCGGSVCTANEARKRPENFAQLPPEF